MYILALFIALIGFAALVAAIVYGSVPWAIACMALGVVGVILLIVDTARRRKK